MSAPLAFVDCETTGLDPDRHEIWEVALILHTDDFEEEHVWHLPVDLGRADPMALNIGRFHERWMNDDAKSSRIHKVKTLASFASEFADLTIGAHLVGAVISFDEERLRRLLRREKQCPMWHYHLVDVEALAAGWIASRLAQAQTVRGFVGSAAPPWNSNDLSRAVGVDPDDFDRHTALGDAYWAKAIYEAVMR